MHSLVFKRPEAESPGKKMSTESKVKETDHKLLSRLDSSPDSPPAGHGESEPYHHDDLFNTATACGTTDEKNNANFCQPCHTMPHTSQINNQIVPHSSTCSYGIQALLNNVHRGYVSDGERTHDQQMISGSTDQGVDASLQPDSEILRQWKRKKEEELKERTRESQTKLDHILEQAAIERENFYKEREAQVEAKKKLNREREAKYHADAEAKKQEPGPGGNLWEAVAALIDLNGEGDSGKTASGATSKHSLSPKSMVDQLSTPKKQDSGKTRHRDYNLPKPTKKTTDLSRMREILLKLQHQPLVR